MDVEYAPQIEALPPGERKRIEEAANVIEAIRLFARPEILKVYGESSCLESGRIVFELLKHYDLKPRAIAVAMRVYNPAFIQRVQKEGHHPTSQEEVMRWSREDGSWNIGIGETGVVRAGRWDGHLVCLSLGRVLIDVSIDQANRPEHNIHLAPVAVTVPDGWMDGNQLAFMENGSMVVYKARPDQRDWLQHGGWRAPTPDHKRVKSQVIDRIAVKVESWLADA